MALAPGRQAPQRRLVFSLLKRERAQEALETAVEMVRLGSGSNEEALFVATAQLEVALAGTGRQEVQLRRLLQLPVLSGREGSRVWVALERPAPLKRPQAVR